MTENIYDLVYVKFNDIRLQARPVDFSFDKNQNPLQPLKYTTTCPGCGALCEILVNGILVEDTQVGCQECTFGLDQATVVKSEPVTVEKIIEVQKEKNEIVVNKSEFAKNSNDFSGRNFALETDKKSIMIDDNDALSSSNPFVDPIALGTFKVDE